MTWHAAHGGGVSDPTDTVIRSKAGSESDTVRRVSDPLPDAPATTSTVHGEVLGFARRILGGQALATLLLMGLAVGGYRALAQEARDGGVAAVLPVAAELERVKSATAEQAHDIAELKRRIERTEVVSVETNANVRLLLQDRGIRPVSTLEPRDGGP